VGKALDICFQAISFNLINSCDSFIDEGRVRREMQVVILPWDALVSQAEQTGSISYERQVNSKCDNSVLSWERSRFLKTS